MGDNVRFPEFVIALPSLQHIGQALGDQERAIQDIETQAALFSQVKVAVVGGVAEVAGGDDIFGIVAFGVTFGQQVVPGQCEPGVEGLGPIRAAVDTGEVVTLVDGEGVAAEGVSVGGHGIVFLISVHD